MVEGRLTFDSWTGKDGVKRSKHRVTVENFQFISSGGARQAAAGESQVPQDDFAAGDAQAGGDDIPF